MISVGVARYDGWGGNMPRCVACSLCNLAAPRAGRKSGLLVVATLETAAISLRQHGLVIGLPAVGLGAFGQAP